MTTNVYRWPPVGLTGWEITTVEPISRSTGLIDGRPRTSSAQRARKYLTAVVPGINYDSAGAGYIEVLKELLDGGRHLVRIEAASSLWHLASAGQNLVSHYLQWSTNGVPLMWTTEGTQLLWSSNLDAQGTPGTDNGWPSITVTGLPPNRIVARPGDLLTVRASPTATAERSRVLTVARSNGSGVAVIRLMTAVTASGLVSIGETESLVVEALDMPRAVQPANSEWTYTWSFRQVFQDEYVGPWVELNPW
jgi:hypothetical protein